MTPQILATMALGAVIGVWRFKSDVAPKATWLDSVDFVIQRPALFFRYLTRWAVYGGGCAWLADLLANR